MSKLLLSSSKRHSLLNKLIKWIDYKNHDTEYKILSILIVSITILSVVNYLMNW